VVDSTNLLEVLRRFAATMSQSYEVSDVLYQLGDSAVTILGADGAGISLASAGDRLEFVTATDQSLIELETVQEARQEGPCVLAFRTGEPVTIYDIAELDMWHEYRKTAARGNFRAVIGMPLAIGERRVGSLNIYQRAPREWSDTELDVARTLADIATAYAVRSGELAEARDVTRELQYALDSRVIIEQAKGALSAQRDLPVDAAFELLRTYARRTNRRLRDVAHEVVHHGLDVS
jgi:GAF domain-containing protein